MIRLATMVLLGLACATTHAAEIDLQRLFTLLKDAKPGRAEFVERKYLALLDKPLETRGELTFTPPDRMEKRTTAPKPERVVVDRERLTLERGGKAYTLGLRENPNVAALVESIRATLAGDLATLTRTYSAALSGSDADWRLLLRPLDPAIATLVERIEIRGAQAQVRTVEIHQADGDRSVMTITPAKG